MQFATLLDEFYPLIKGQVRKIVVSGSTHTTIFLNETGTETIEVPNTLISIYEAQPEDIDYPVE
jgi:hypothetical protein